MDPERKLLGIEAEIANEKASSLGFAGRRLEAALTALREHDAHGGAALRHELLAEAAERLWYYVVQRDAMGWHDHTAALAIFQIPGEVLAHMGPRSRGGQPG